MKSIKERPLPAPAALSLNGAKKRTREPSGFFALWVTEVVLGPQGENKVYTEASLT